MVNSTENVFGTSSALSVKERNRPLQYNVVYLIGAGFSAPMGIPIVSNFLEKSKDQFFNDPQRFAHFRKVFETIASMAVTKGYYKTDLTNIEEILSILEMREQFTQATSDSQFRKYIADVIEYHTPAIGDRPWGRHWTSLLFGPPPWANYGAFVAALFGQTFEFVPDPTGGNVFSYRANSLMERAFKYSVVTLNYDLIFEHCAEYMNTGFKTSLKFKREWDESTDLDSIYLAKLHGGVGRGEEIIPPTWNKSLNHQGIIPAWQIAYNVLSEAHHIRIVGYSLPMNDSYIRYLLRAAVIDSTHHHLKNIDVLCLDPDGSVKARYDEFMQFHKYRFCSARTEDYLKAYVDCLHGWPRQITGDELELAHDRFCKV